MQRELLQHCKDKYLKQMLGNTDTEFLYVLLLSLLESDSDEDVKRAFEEMLRLIAQAMKKLDLVALTKLKMALVSRTASSGSTSAQATTVKLIRLATGESSRVGPGHG